MTMRRSPNRNWISGRVAIVTGASGGIGRATALALARAGADVVLSARNRAKLEEVADAVRDAGRQALIAPADVTNQIQVDGVIQAALGHWNRLDILVANAGDYVRCPVSELSVAHLEHAMAVNYYGSVYAVLAVLPTMLLQGSGHIVLVTSMNGKKGVPPDAPYAAAKFALSGFAEVLRQELRGTGVYVTTVFPGRVDTPMIETLRVPRISAKISAQAVADAIVRAIDRRSPEVIIPFLSRGLILANTISPRLGDWVVRFFHLEGWDKPPAPDT